MKCPECGYQSGAHSFYCTYQSDGAKVIHFAIVAKEAKRHLQRESRGYEKAREWQAKYHTLRLENNALRKKLYQMRGKAHD